MQTLSFSSELDTRRVKAGVSLLLQCTSTLDHGAPVQAVAFLPGGALLATAGGTEIRSARPLLAV